MENANKRSSSEAGLDAKSSPKASRRFYMPRTFDEANYEIQTHVNWTGKKLPIIVPQGFKPKSNDPKKIKNLSLATPMVSTKFCDLSVNGDIGKFNKTADNACYNLNIVNELPSKITDKIPDAQKRSDAFFTWLKDTVNQMLVVGYETEGVWEKWKKAAEKEHKKQMKKNPDTAASAKDIFLEKAKTSVFSQFEDDDGNEIPMYSFSCKYQLKFGDEIRNNRPAFYKQIRNEFGDRSVVDISDNLPSKKSGLMHGSVIKFGFELNCFDLDTMYGVKAQLKDTILCIHLQKSNQRSVSQMIGSDTYFSDDDEN